LSRNDFAPRDNLHFNEAIFTTLTESNPGADVYNTTSMGQVQHAQLTLLLTTNPSVMNTRKEFNVHTCESGLYLSVIGDFLTGVASKEFVQIFFREEQLPIVEGWTR
ncbi:hypothetical protein B0H10DRAFT_1734641, partial [Mycena sp. CBHHK59/15]